MSLDHLRWYLSLPPQESMQFSPACRCAIVLTDAPGGTSTPRAFAFGGRRPDEVVLDEEILRDLGIAPT